jgi:S1-C subfamily serine protease
VADVFLLALLGGAAILGWRRGLLVSLVGAGAFILGGLPLAALAAGLGVMAPALAFLVGGLIGIVPVGLRIDRLTDAVDAYVADDRWRRADRVAGAVLNLCVAICISWFLAALASILPGDSPALTSMRTSAVFSSLVEAVPPQGTLGVVVLRSGLVPGIDGPLVLAQSPDPASERAPGVVAARASVLEVRSTSCNRIVTGSGWVAGPGIVVTNAHVVAGTTQSFLAGGPSFDGARAVVTAFDPINDIAVLVLDPAGAAVLPPPLRVASRVQHDERAAVIGFPKGGEQRVDAARIDRIASYDVEPLGGGVPSKAQILAFLARVQPGNSGGPIVAEDGSVLGLVVSRGLGQRNDAAYGVASATLLPVIAEGSQRVPHATGRCLSEDDLITEKHGDG